jgi:plasmid stabilization system protein ParE
MKYRVVLSSHAEQDLSDIVSWYDAIDRRVTDRFDAEVHRAFTFIEENPFLYARTQGDRRRTKLPSFPYLVIYEILAEAVVVIAIFHTSRLPTIWQSRQ